MTVGECALYFELTSFSERMCYILIYILITMIYFPILDTIMSVRSNVQKCLLWLYSPNTFRFSAEVGAHAERARRHGFGEIVFSRIHIRMRMQTACTWISGPYTHTFVRNRLFPCARKMLSVFRYSHHKIKLQDKKTTRRGFFKLN